LPTISDVAREAGVSTVTVSRVINGEPNVNATTREKVQAAVAALGYVPNVAARSLRSKRTHTLALLVPDITNVFWTTIARGVEDAAQALGYSVLLCNTDENPDKQARYLQVVASQRVDGVIIAPYNADAANLRQLEARAIPTVVVDRRVDGWDVDSVYGDSVGGAAALVRHLIGVGHRRIAVISGPRGASTADDRVDGYCRALAEAGLALDPALVKRGEFRVASGEALAGELLALAEPPTAIFAANNAIVLGAAWALAKQGRRVPQDVALVCFDDLPETALLFPFLTVVVQPAYEMGVHAAQLLLDRLKAGEPLPPRRVVLPARLIIRYSCGSRLGQGQEGALSLPIQSGGDTETVLVELFEPGPLDAAPIKREDA
jgi:LacI family transcriptional regulator